MPAGNEGIVSVASAICGTEPVKFTGKPPTDGVPELLELELLLEVLLELVELLLELLEELEDVEELELEEPVVWVTNETANCSILKPELKSW